MRGWILVSCLVAIAGLPGYASTAGVNGPFAASTIRSGFVITGGTNQEDRSPMISAITDFENQYLTLDGETPTGTVLAIFGLSGIGLLALRRSAHRD